MPFIYKIIFLQIKPHFCVRTPFETEAKDNSLMTYSRLLCFVLTSQVIGLRKLAPLCPPIRSKMECGKLRTVLGNRGSSMSVQTRWDKCLKHFFMNNNEQPAYMSENTTFIWRHVEQRKTTLFPKYYNVPNLMILLKDLPGSILSLIENLLQYVASKFTTMCRVFNAFWKTNFLCITLLWLLSIPLKKAIYYRRLPFFNYHALVLFLFKARSLV